MATAKTKKSKTTPRSYKVAKEKETPRFKTPVGDKKAFDQLLDDSVLGVQKTKTGK